MPFSTFVNTFGKLSLLYFYNTYMPPSLLTVSIIQLFMSLVKLYLHFLQKSFDSFLTNCVYCIVFLFMCQWKYDCIMWLFCNISWSQCSCSYFHLSIAPTKCSLDISEQFINVCGNVVSVQYTAPAGMC